MVAEFLDWVKSDNVVRLSNNYYITQCTLWSKKFLYNELYSYYKKEYGKQ